MDNITPERRSEIMSLVRSKDSKAEMAVRKLVHGMGYRYRLHAKDLPGKPDLVFRPRKKAIFVHGCFWHGHAGCRNHRIPKSKIEYWSQKIANNAARDKKVRRRLKALGYATLVIWECEVKAEARLAKRIERFLSE